MTTTTPTFASTARIETASGSRYLQQLCKHFAHKMEAVEFDPHSGLIPFGLGPCRLAADEGGLTLAVSAASAEELERLKDVVVRHLVRFAFREELAVNWVDSGALPAAA